MNTLLKGLKKAQKATLWHQSIDWQAYLPKELAEGIRGTQYRQKKLWLQVNSSAFSHQIHLRKGELLAALAARFPEQPIVDIRCRLN